MKLYDFSASGNGYKVRWLLHWLQCPFERIEVDVRRGEQRSPDYLALNPTGTVPLLVFDQGDTLAESNAILWTLAQGSALLPTDPRRQSLVLQWLFYEQSRIDPLIAGSRRLLRLYQSEDRATRLAILRPGAERCLAHVDAHLAQHAFAVPPDITLADLALYGYLHIADQAGFDLTPYPHLSSWIQRVEAWPGYIGMADSCCGFPAT